VDHATYEEGGDYGEEGEGMIFLVAMDNGKGGGG